MAYALMILEPHGQRAARGEAEGRKRYEQMVRFSEELKERCLLTLAQSLKSDNEGVRLRMGAAEPSIVDGPFAESKEMIGGFFVLTCEHRDQAISIARQCPALGWATVEVRELGPCF